MPTELERTLVQCSLTTQSKLDWVRLYEEKQPESHKIRDVITTMKDATHSPSKQGEAVQHKTIGIDISKYVNNWIPDYTILEQIGRVNEYPTMHYFGNSIHTRFMIAYMILTEYFWNSSENLHCGNVVNMSYYHIWHIVVRSLTCSHNTDLFLSHVYSSLRVYLTVQISRLTVIHRYVQVSNLYNRYMVYKVDQALERGNIVRLIVTLAVGTDAVLIFSYKANCRGGECNNWKIINF